MNTLTTNPFEQLGSVRDFADRNGLDIRSSETLPVYTDELQRKCAEVAKELGITIPELHNLRPARSPDLASN